jgi:hypothetical protein
MERKETRDIPMLTPDDSYFPRPWDIEECPGDVSINQERMVEPAEILEWEPLIIPIRVSTASV